MRLRSRNLTPALAVLVLLSLMAATMPSGLHASAAPSAPAGTSLHRLHFLYDKATGRHVDDPTVQTPASAAAEDEVKALQARKREQMDPTRITFRSGLTIHPKAGMATGVQEALSATSDAASGRFWLIQFGYPFPTEARAQLEEAGVAFYDYVDVCAFFAMVPPGALPLLKQMLDDGLVHYVGGIPPEAKVQRALAAEAMRDPTAGFEIVVLTFGQPTPMEVDKLEQWMAIEGQSTGPIPLVEGTASGAALQTLAELDFVRWVEQRGQAELGNLEGGMGVGGDLVRANGYDGTGVQVMVVDSGIARQSTMYHPDLQGDRIVDQWDSQDGDEDATDDYLLANGHGTHVAGTIGGRYNAGDPNSVRSHQGLATDADLLIYRLFGPVGFSTDAFNYVLGRATTDPLRADVSSNSWGQIGSWGVYSITAEYADAAVRGVYNDKPVNVVAAAMNEDRLVRSPGNGKNVIAVGAVKDGGPPFDTPVSNSYCDAADYNWPPGERLCYSNYGPVDTDSDSFTRVKPDLVAPGAMITSAAPWYPPFSSSYYRSTHGTSQATPHVTGAIAQLLDAYSDVEGGALFEWPEMVKAMLLAAAVDVGGDTNHYGHGMLDAYHAILAEPGASQPMDVWGSSLSSTDETRTFTFYVPPDYHEVRVVLTWADPQGYAEVVNDLDIVSIKDGNGTLRGSAASLDDTVEVARIPAGYTPGTWTIRVAATSVTDSQPFALAAHVIMADADLSIRAVPASAPGTPHAFVPGGEFYLDQYISNSGYTAGGSYAKLQATEGFTVTGVTVLTGDGYEHWYDASELYQEPGFPDDWYVAVGDTAAGSDRQVRWSIEIDEATECGSYIFQSTAYWLAAGVERSSTTVNTRFPVACHFTYLPLALEQY